MGLFLLGCAVGALVTLGLLLWMVATAVRVISRDALAKDIARRQLALVTEPAHYAMPQATDTLQ